MLFTFLGQIISLSEPVVINNQFVGVAGVDFRLATVFRSIVNYRPNEYSYAFVINDAGNK